MFIDFYKKLLYYLKNFKRKEKKKIKKQTSTQKWLPFDKILEKGIIVSKNKYIKIIQVIPINYDLKSKLEKESILNSYKLFLKTCNFDIQILIQSKKEDLSNQISQVKEINKNEKNKKIKLLSEKYINYINQKNNENKSATKDFFIIVSYKIENKNKEENQIQEAIIINYLNEAFFKIKESLSRCGNIIYEINSKEEVQKILDSFINP